MTRIPIRLAATLPTRADSSAALILAAPLPMPPGYAVVRHADAAAAAQAGSCGCCRVPSGLTKVLRQLFLDRVRGETSFGHVLVVGCDEPAAAEAMSDPLVTARFEYRGVAP